MIRFVTLGFPSCPPPLYLSTLRSERGFTVVRWILGILLITTAVMKMSGGSGEILRVALPFVSPRIYSSGVVFEFILGLWLISGIAKAWSWLISSIFFGLLGYMSFQLGIYGQASCGCFGKIAVNPWWAFAIDVGAIIGLFTFPPANVIAGLRRGIPTIAGATGILAFLSGSAIWWYGSAGAALAHIRDELIVVSPEVGDIGAGKRGEFGKLILTVTNYSDRTVRIVGGTSDCACVAIDDFPIEIRPTENRSVTIRVRFTGSTGVFRRTFVLFADTEKLKVMPVAVTGRTLE